MTKSKLFDQSDRKTVTMLENAVITMNILKFQAVNLKARVTILLIVLRNNKVEQTDAPKVYI